MLQINYTLNNTNSSCEISQITESALCTVNTRVSVFTGLDYWTGLLDWTTGLENHTQNERILTTLAHNLGKITS